MSISRTPPTVMLLFVICGSTAARAQLDAGVVPATRKVLPDAPMPAVKTAELKAARNEWEAFQIVIRDPQGAAGVDVVLADLAGPDGAAIPAVRARLFREHFVEVTDVSPGGVTFHERQLGLYPDPLIPFRDPYADGASPVGAPFDLGPGETGVVFVDIHVPSDALPGGYSGTATVSAIDRDSVEIPLTIEVWEFDIPAERTIGTSFGFGMGDTRAFHGGPGPDVAPEYETIRDRYIEALHEHRVDITTVRGPVEFEFDAGGSLAPVDWTGYDAYVEPWITGERFGDGVGVARFNVGHFKPGSGTGSMTDEQYAVAAKAFAEHLEDRGWWDKTYIYAHDEPWIGGGTEKYERIKRDGDLLFRHTELWAGRVLVTSPWHEIIADITGIWCPVTPRYEDWFYLGGEMAGREEYAECLTRGQELWFYVCNANTPPYAGYDIDTAIGFEPRIVKWGTWFERATGFLFWRVTYWVDEDPWNVLLNVEQFGDLGARNGDGFLLYPGDHDGTAAPKGSPDWLAVDGPIVSYRLKQIRDGLEDWEMFRLAESLGGGEYAQAQVSRAYTRFGDFFVEDCTIEGGYCPERQPWTIDESVLLDAREQIARKILFLLHPDKYPDPEAAPDADADADADADESCSCRQDRSEDDGCGCGGAGRAGGFGALVLLLVVGRRRRTVSGR